jgi:hypothetical protein
MSTQVSLSLPDEVYQRAEHLAHLTGRDVSEVLADAIRTSLEPLGPSTKLDRPIRDLTDAEVLALTKLTMSPEQDRRLSKLLDRQQAGLLTEPQRVELHALMQAYGDGLVRKARALEEAVRRGLREPLPP